MHEHKISNKFFAANILVSRGAFRRAWVKDPQTLQINIYQSIDELTRRVEYELTGNKNDDKHAAFNALLTYINTLCYGEEKN